MAKGILMQRDGLTDVQAFNLLVSTSQNANIKLHDIAVWLIDNANNAARRAD
jgi:AmiR/NasT family two-component response regulator